MAARTPIISAGTRKVPDPSHGRTASYACIVRLAALVDQPRRDHPDAMLPEVQECHGAPAAEAPAATGAHVAHRWLRHRLPLRQEHQDTT